MGPVSLHSGLALHPLGHSSFGFPLHPATFVGDSLRRAIWFWVCPLNFWPLSVAIDAGALAGLIVVFRRSRNVALSLLTVLAVYPLIYYASQVVSRYRHPIDPVLYALSGVALSQIIQRRATKRDDAIG